MKSKQGLKIVAAILVILAIPFLFFQVLGGSILAMNEAKKPVIAVVNEDLGDTRNAEKVEMGKEVVAILEEDSPYEWKVMSRGAAESGLATTQYEAIVYIPSDFSENVMSYEEQNPQKAEFAIEVQEIKSAAAKEELVNELTKSTERVNERLSTLYWSYVAIEMDHIKKEFANILQSEMEFLDVMSEYYSSGSSSLAEQMEGQKTIIEGMQSMLGSAMQNSDSSAENVAAFENQLEDFVVYVQDYKDFQAKQRDILVGLQDTSLAKIQSAAAQQVEQYNEMLAELEDHNEKLTNEMDKVDEQIEKHRQEVEALSVMRKQVVDRQLRDLLFVQETAFNRYNESLLTNLEKKIAAAQRNPGSVRPGPTIESAEQVVTNISEMEQKAKEKSNQTLINLEEEQQRVATLTTSVLALKESLQEVDPASPAISSIESLETELEHMKETLTRKSGELSKTTESAKDDYLKATNDYIKLYESYQTVYAKYQSVNDTINSYPANTARLLREIEKVESSILKHEDLTNKRRLPLEELFSNKVENTDTNALLSYYTSLVQFEFVLNERVQQEGSGKSQLLKDDIMQALLKNAINLSDEELEGWETLEESIPETEKVVDDLNTSFAAILTGFEETIEMQHTSLVTELGSIEEQANVLLAQIREPQMMIASGEPVQTSDEAEVLSGQHNISSELLSLSSLVDTLAQQQNGLVTQANSLHAKANDLQTTTTDFSEKWGTNLDSMSAFKEDIQDFLGNTYVDGQVNGYAFNHLVNPLEVTGETALAGEFKKVPPIILYLILLVSSLLIGYFTHRLNGGGIGQQVGMIALLSVLVGLIISFYSVNMYVLSDNRAIQWTIFTVLLLLASAATIRAALDFGQGTGWVASILVMCIYILPLLVLGVPDINVPDLLSAVYNSLKYDVETNFAVGTAVTTIIALAMMIVSYVLSKRKVGKPHTEEQGYEG